MFKDYLKALSRYKRNEDDALALRTLATLKKEIRRDLLEAFEMGLPFVEAHPTLYDESSSFVDFMFKLLDVEEPPRGCRSVSRCPRCSDEERRGAARSDLATDECSLRDDPRPLRADPSASGDRIPLSSGVFGSQREARTSSDAFETADGRAERLLETVRDNQDAFRVTLDVLIGKLNEMTRKIEEKYDHDTRALATESSALKSDLVTLYKTMEAFNQNFTEMKQISENWKKRMEEANATLLEVRDARHSLSEVADGRSRYLVSLPDRPSLTATDELLKLQEENAGLRSRAEEYGQSILGLQGDCGTRQKENETLRAENEGLRVDNSNLRTELQACVTRNSLLQSKASVAEAQVGSLGNETALLLDKNIHLEKELASCKNEIVRLIQVNSALTASSSPESLGTKLANSYAEREELQRSVEKMRQALDARNSEYRTVSDEIVNLKSSLAASQQTIGRMEEEKSQLLSKMQTDETPFPTENSELQKNNLEILKEEKDSLVKSVKDLNGAVDEKRLELEKLTGECEKIKTTVLELQTVRKTEEEKIQQLLREKQDAFDSSAATNGMEITDETKQKNLELENEIRRLREEADSKETAIEKLKESIAKQTDDFNNQLAEKEKLLEAFPERGETSEPTKRDEIENLRKTYDEEMAKKVEEIQTLNGLIETLEQSMQDARKEGTKNLKDAVEKENEMINSKEVVENLKKAYLEKISEKEKEMEKSMNEIEKLKETHGREILEKTEKFKKLSDALRERDAIYDKNIATKEDDIRRIKQYYSKLDEERNGEIQQYLAEINRLKEYIKTGCHVLQMNANKLQTIEEENKMYSTTIERLQDTEEQIKLIEQDYKKQLEQKFTEEYALKREISQYKLNLNKFNFFIENVRRFVGVLHSPSTADDQSEKEQEFQWFDDWTKFYGNVIEKLRETIVVLHKDAPFIDNVEIIYDHVLKQRMEIDSLLKTVEEMKLYSKREEADPKRHVSSSKVEETELFKDFETYKNFDDLEERKLFVRDNLEGKMYKPFFEYVESLNLLRDEFYALTNNLDEMQMDFTSEPDEEEEESTPSRGEGVTASTSRDAGDAPISKEAEEASTSKGADDDPPTPKGVDEASTSKEADDVPPSSDKDVTITTTISTHYVDFLKKLKSEISTLKNKLQRKQLEITSLKGRKKAQFSRKIIEKSEKSKKTTDEIGAQLEKENDDKSKKSQTKSKSYKRIVDSLQSAYEERVPFSGISLKEWEASFIERVNEAFESVNRLKTYIKFILNALFRLQEKHLPPLNESLPCLRCRLDVPKDTFPTYRFECDENHVYHGECLAKDLDDATFEYTCRSCKKELFPDMQYIVTQTDPQTRPSEAEDAVLEEDSSTVRKLSRKRRKAGEDEDEDCCTELETIREEYDVLQKQFAEEMENKTQMESSLKQRDENLKKAKDKMNELESQLKICEEEKEQLQNKLKTQKISEEGIRAKIETEYSELLAEKDKIILRLKIEKEQLTSIKASLENRNKIEETEDATMYEAEGSQTFDPSTSDDDFMTNRDLRIIIYILYLEYFALMDEIFVKSSVNINLLPNIFENLIALDKKLDVTKRNVFNLKVLLEFFYKHASILHPNIIKPKEKMEIPENFRDFAEFIVNEAKAFFNVDRRKKMRV